MVTNLTKCVNQHCRGLEILKKKINLSHIYLAVYVSFVPIPPRRTHFILISLSQTDGRPSGSSLLAQLGQKLCEIA